MAKPDPTARPVRALLLLPSLHGGGAERVAVDLANHCDREQVDVRIGLLRRTGPYLDEADPARISASPYCPHLLDIDRANAANYTLRNLVVGAALVPANLARLIADARPDVVMTFLKGTSIATRFALASFLRRRPRWIAREGNNTYAVIDDEIAGRAGRAAVKALAGHCYRSADRVLAISQGLAGKLRQDMGLSDQRVSAIHNPIDLQRIRCRAETPIERSDARPFIVAAGRLEHQKGHDLLLRAFAASEACADHDLVILGKGSREAELRKLARKLGIADRVDFRGFASNPWAWFAKARLFVLPSRWEGFGSVVAEALACGVPCVVTDCDFGPREIVEDGVSGLVVPRDDAAALTAAMDRLIGDSELSRRLGCAARERAERFDVSVIVKQYTELFLDEAARRR